MGGVQTRQIQPKLRIFGPVLRGLLPHPGLLGQLLRRYRADLHTLTQGQRPPGWRRAQRPGTQAAEDLQGTDLPSPANGNCMLQRGDAQTEIATGLTGLTGLTGSLRIKASSPNTWQINSSQASKCCPASRRPSAMPPGPQLHPHVQTHALEQGHRGFLVGQRQRFEQPKGHDRFTGW